MKHIIALALSCLALTATAHAETCVEIRAGLDTLVVIEDAQLHGALNSQQLDAFNAVLEVVSMPPLSERHLRLLGPERARTEIFALLDTARSDLRTMWKNQSCQ